MKEAKKQMGAAYYENYDDYTPNRPVRSNGLGNPSRVIRGLLFLALIGSMVYKSGMITPIIKGQGALSYYSSKRPSGLTGIGAPLLGKKEQACSDYLQETSRISQELSYIMENYISEKTNAEVSKDKLFEIWGDLSQIEVIKDGEPLRKTVVENLTQSLQYITQIEVLRSTRNVTTEAERISWYKGKDSAEQLHLQLKNIANRQMADIKDLLEQYDMGYVESEKGIEYYYRQEGPQ